jgi:hypothetical protein
VSGLKESVVEYFGILPSGKPETRLVLKKTIIPTFGQDQDAIEGLQSFFTPGLLLSFLVFSFLVAYNI